MDVSQLTPRRPYLLRAFYDWLLDNQLTPHLVVDVTLPGVLVPMEYARDGQIVLNIAPRAVGNLELANDEVRFNARFGGVPRNVSVPLAAVLAIYARENGAGTMLRIHNVDTDWPLFSSRLISNSECAPKASASRQNNMASK